jgi:uncharacterized protein (DUF4415 family)
MEEPVEGDKPSRRGRGPGKKPPMTCTSLRLPKEVMDFFDQFPSKQTRMREVLVDFVKRQQGNYSE